MVNSTWIRNLPTPIAVVGLGKSGISALHLLKAIGLHPSSIITYDERHASADFQNSQDLLSAGPKTLVVSPGVPLSTVWIQSLIFTGVLITSEISLAASLLTTEKTIGITGSVGKSTVVSILGQGAKIEDANCFVGGNLGTPLCDYAFQLVQGKPKANWIILELSSYQLENCTGLRLDFSAITYLSPNHLERYLDLYQYYETKMRITSITKSACVFNAASPDAVRYSARAICLAHLASAKKDLPEKLRQTIRLIGEHNHDNFAVAWKLSQLAGWSEPSVATMAQYEGLPHRLENIGTYDGIQFINDSKATAMDSVRVATHGCYTNLKSGRWLYLLLGGKDKNLPWQQLHALQDLTSIHFIFFGECRNLAKDKMAVAGETYETLSAAMDHCLRCATDGDIVLLSPGGTSLDEFKNFEERGHFFKSKILSFYK